MLRLKFSFLIICLASTWLGAVTDSKPLYSVEEALVKANKNQLPASFTMHYTSKNGESFYVHWQEQNNIEHPTIWLQSENKLKQLEYSGPRIYRGHILKLERSIANLIIKENVAEIILSSRETGNVFIAKEKEQPVLYAQESPYLQPANMNRPCHPDHSNERGTLNLRTTTGTTCKKVYISVTADYDLYQNFSSDPVQVTNYIEGAFAVVQSIYALEEVQIGIQEIIIHQSPDILRHLTALDDLNIFRFIRPTYNGHIALCLSGYKDASGSAPLGGHAFINALCNTSLSYAYVNVDGAYNNYPNYSWDIFGITHEIGHVIGSPHTHACEWGPAGNEALDDCAPPEGTCAAGPPVSRGTIMSYCHTAGKPGIFFSDGFGDEPGDLIRSKIASATCLNDYIPQSTQSRIIGSVTANMECNDGQYTHYYFDNNTITESDDILILSIDKAGADIGHVYDGSLVIKSSYSSNVANSIATQITAPYVPAGASYFVMNKFWEIQPSSQPSSNVTVRLPYLVADFNDLDASVVQSLIVSEIKAFLIEPNGTADPDLNHSGTTTSLYTEYSNGPNATTTTWKHISSSGLEYAEFKTSDLDEFGLGAFSITALPVDLIAFDAKRVSPTQNIITWESGFERELQHFEVTSSTDGKTFETLGRVPAKGSDSSYSLFDDTDEGRYYRLTMVNTDNSEDISKIAFVEGASITDRSPEISGVVMNGLLDVKNTDMNVSSDYQIVSVCGRTVIEGRWNKGQARQVKVEALPSGMYFISLASNGLSRQLKFVKM